MPFSTISDQVIVKNPKRSFKKVKTFSAKGAENIKAVSSVKSINDSFKWKYYPLSADIAAEVSAIFSKNCENSKSVKE